MSAFMIRPRYRQGSVASRHGVSDGAGPCGSGPAHGEHAVCRQVRNETRDLYSSRGDVPDLIAFVHLVLSLRLSLDRMGGTRRTPTGPCLPGRAHDRADGPAVSERAPDLASVARRGPPPHGSSSLWLDQTSCAASARPLNRHKGPDRGPNRDRQAAKRPDPSVDRAEKANLVPHTGFLVNRLMRLSRVHPALPRDT